VIQRGAVVNMCTEYVICNGSGREKLVDIVVRTDYALLGILLSVNLINHFDEYNFVYNFESVSRCNTKHLQLT
jgi:hypothetical protein